METPELKQLSDLSAGDFEHHRVWVGVRHFDIDQPWFENADDQTFRPWLGPLPLQQRSRFSSFLVAAVFELADKTTYPGYFNPTSRDWDEPIQGRKLRDGSYSKPQSWSERRGGDPRSILALLRPAIFVGKQPYDFHLRRIPDARAKAIRDFYAAVGKSPDRVFPVRFHADRMFFDGIVDGHLEGFYSFPLDRPFEIDRGEQFLAG